MTIQQNLGLPFGILVASNPFSFGIENLNSATNYIGYSFIARANTSLSAVRFYVSSKTGTPSSINCLLYGDSANKPNIAGGSLDTLTVGTLTASTWCSANGGTYSLTTGTRYWVVFTNTTGTPSSNYISLIYGSSYLACPWSTDSTATSTNSGTSWTLAQMGGIRFDFADGTYYGMPFKSGGTSPLITVYSSNEAGAIFTTPANAKMNVAGIAFQIGHVGSPTGNISFKLYDSTHSLIASTDKISNSEAMGLNGWHYRLFSSVQTLNAGATYTVTVANDAADSMGNSYNFSGYTWDSDSNSLALVPYSTELDVYNGTSWSQTSTFIPAFALLLATGNEFTSTGGGGGMLYMPGMDGGCNL